MQSEWLNVFANYCACCVLVSTLSLFLRLHQLYEKITLPPAPCADGVVVITISLYPEVPGFDPRARQEKEVPVNTLVCSHGSFVFTFCLHFLRRSDTSRGITSPWRAILGWAKATTLRPKSTFFMSMYISASEVVRGRPRLPRPHFHFDLAFSINA